ncbi:MAG: GntR family transcriptional regulator [Coriobacteriales bacterium]|jgi:DNA-binding FadR family transcriptional regulator|nr:GntR family transcriptional regulator [Coriobacteriales bacterium]
MPFRKLEAPSLKELFVRELREDILSGELAVGVRLPPERELALAMGVSRAVINGGIRELARTGFVEIIPRRGTFVADYKRHGRMETLTAVIEYNNGHLDPVILDSIYEMRTVIERHLAELAARRHSAEDLAELRDQLEIIAASDDMEVLVEATTEFYHLLALASGNIIYPLNMQAYRPLYLAMFRRVYERSSKAERVAQLTVLCECLEAGNAEAAADTVSAIIEWGRGIVLGGGPPTTADV